MLVTNRYIYSTLRFVPDPARGEFVNIGVVVGSNETKEWTIRTADNMRRARYLDDERVISQALTVIDDIGRKLDLYSQSVWELFPSDYEINEKWLREFYERSHNVIQLSPPAVLVATDIEEAVDLLFEEFIIDPIRKRRGVTKHRVYSAIVRAYKQVGIWNEAHVHEHAKVESGAYSGKFDFVVANGKAVQLTHAWSFQIAEQSLLDSVKAWGWTVQDLRQSGGEVQLHGKRVAVPRDVEIDVVYVPPLASQRDAFKEAKQVFSDVGVSLFEVAGATSVAVRAEKLLSDSDQEEDNG